MASENLPRKDALFAPWIINFASVATANATLLNLSSGQTTNLTATATAFATSLTNSTESKAAAKADVATKNDLRTASNALFGGTAKVIAANGNISNALKGELGLSVTPSTIGPVVPVSELSSEGKANGVNKLRWNRNGNADGTVYLIEGKVGTAVDWSLIDASTRAKYEHTGQTPGVQVTYRVISQRANIKSGPSTETVVYSTSGGESVSLKLAA